MASLLDDDNLLAVNKEAVFEAVARWIKRNSGEGLIGEGLLHKVRLPLMSFEYLAGCAAVNGLDGATSLASLVREAVLVKGVTTGLCKAVLEGHTGSIFSLAVSFNLLLSRSVDNSVKAWTLWETPSTWRCERTLTGHEECVNCVVGCWPRAFMNKTNS